MALVPIKRPDFSQALIHLTRYRKTQVWNADKFVFEVVETTPPFQVLKEILTSGVLRGSGNEGFVKGSQKAVCFSEIPLSAVHHFASEGPDARYCYYGVVLSKQAAFAAGGRPVIYLPDNEGDWIPAGQKWRHVRFEFGNVDFTHEREWRCPGDLDLTKMPGMQVLVWSPDEANEILTMNSPLQHLIRSVLPMKHLSAFL
jgi:hypothetical protein